MTSANMSLTRTSLALLVLLTACTSKKNEPPTLTSAIAPSAQPPSFASKASMAVPLTRSLIPKQSFAIGGDLVTVELCRLDGSGPPLLHRESRTAAPRIAAAPDGTVWMLDHEKKLRRYLNRSSTACELALDPSFGKDGIMDLGEASKSVSSLAVDNKNTLYLTSDSKTKKLTNGALTDHCNGFVKTQPTAKLMLLDNGLLQDNCTRRSLTFAGYAKDAQTRPVGFFDDEILVRGVEKQGDKDLYTLGVQRADGTQRLKLGKREGDESVWGLDMATRCGSDICVFADVINSVRISRFSRNGAFVGKKLVDLWGLRELSFAAGSNEDTFISASTSASTSKDDHAGVVLLVRSKPSPTLLQPPPREPIAGPARGKIRGQPFVATKVAFDFTFGKWRVKASNERGSMVSTSLQVPPRTGAISLSGAAEPRASGNAYLDPVDSTEPPVKGKKMSSDVAGSVREHRIEITRWDVRPYDKAQGGRQDLGYASGKLMIDYPYEPKDRPAEDSLVVGEFTDAVVSTSEDPEAPKK